jgi:hydroxyethylthiazole kinase-like uncharacterized protein yjeF
MVDPFSTPGDLAALAGGLDCVVIGPAAGLTPATEANLMALSGTQAALIVDADALTLFRQRAEVLFACLRPGDVLTPHEGEFERVFPGLLAKGRETAAREASRRSGAHVILKGPGTLIAAPDGRLRINPNGSPWLATAGSGDVLAGLVGGLIAQGMDPFEAASAAVWRRIFSRTVCPVLTRNAAMIPTNTNTGIETIEIFPDSSARKEAIAASDAGSKRDEGSRHEARCILSYPHVWHRK